VLDVDYSAHALARVLVEGTVVLSRVSADLVSREAPMAQRAGRDDHG
jgi:hypothetical protein